MVLFIRRKLLLCSLSVLTSFALVNAEVPNRFSVYSSSGLFINGNATIDGGFVGCQTFVKAGGDVSIRGSIEAAGDIILSGSHVEGNATAGGVVVVEPERDPAGNFIPGTMATVAGDVTENASVVAYTIPVKYVTIGKAIVILEENGNKSITPGNFKKILLGKNSTLTLSEGEYNINELVLEEGSVLNLEFSESQGIDINVKSQLNILSGSKIQITAGTDVSKVNIYFNGFRMAIGANTIISGNFTAPKALTTIGEDAKLTGKLFVKQAMISSNVKIDGLESVLVTDTDNDGVPDYVEEQSGTDPEDPSAGPAVVVQGTYKNETAEGPQTVVLSVEHELGYSRNQIPITFAQGSVGGDLIPIMDIIPKPSELPDVPDDNGSIRLDGIDGEPMLFSIKGTINQGHNLYMGFPLSDAALSLPLEFLRLYHFDGNSWQQIPIDAIQGGVAYAYVSSFSFYAVGIFRNLYRVNPEQSFYDPSENNYTSVSDALTAIRNNPNHGIQKFVVLIRGGISLADYQLNSIPPFKTSIIGGYGDLPGMTKTTLSSMLSTSLIEVADAGDFEVNSKIEIWDATNYQTVTITNKSGNQLSITPLLNYTFTSGSTVRGKFPVDVELGNDPKKNPTCFIQATGNSAPILTLNQYDVSPVDIYIDGITFKNGVFSGSSNAAVVFRSGHHWTTLKIRNCIFLNNTSTGSSAAVNMYNVSQIYFLSCFFIGNSTTGSYGGSAVCAQQVNGCGVGATFESCVFYNNTATGTSSAPILNMNSGGTQNPQRYLSFINCTMFQNSGTEADVLYAHNYVYYNYSNGTYTPDNLVIENCIFWNTNGNSSFVTRYDHYTNTFDDPAPYLTDPGTNLYTIDPHFVNSIDPDGYDNIWGTHDDGLQLQFDSPGRNTSTAYSQTPPPIPPATSYIAPVYDATGRRRTGFRPASQNRDKGAYERYINILPVGDYNTIGSPINNYPDRTMYQAYLKQNAENNGYLVDFVGPFSTGQEFSATTLQLLQRDPSNPDNPDPDGPSGAYDIQCGAAFAGFDAARTEGTIGYFNSGSVFNSLCNTTYDCALLMLGSFDMYRYDQNHANPDRRAILSQLGSFADALAQDPRNATKQVLISCIPSPNDNRSLYYQFNYESDGFYSNYFLSTFNRTNVHRIGTANTYSDLNYNYGWTFDTENYIGNNTDYEHVALRLWEALNNFGVLGQ